MDTFENGYALLIGVGADLQQTRNDARALYELLTNPHRAGYPEDHVELLTDETELKATRQNILAAFDRLAHKTAQDPDATALIYYSGHGHEFVIAGKPVGYYLLPLDYNLKNLNNTAISGQIFTDKIKQIKAKKQIVFLDCCFAAAIPKTKDDLVESTPQNMPVELQALELGSGQVIVASCDKDEKSVTDEEHSVFTRALLDALGGEAFSYDHYARFYSVMMYLTNQVPSRAAQARRDVKQNVVLKTATDLKGDFALCRIPGARLSIPGPDPRYSYLYRALLPLGFPAERLSFARLRKSAYTSAFLIHGTLWYGHYWLLRLLLDELKKEGAFPYQIDMGRCDIQADLACLWSYLCRELQIDEDTPKEHIYQVVADALENHPVALILGNVQYTPPDNIPGMLDDFWKTLAAGVQAKLKPSARFRLHLFLVYVDQPTRTWPVALPEKRDRVDPPYYLKDFQLSLMGEERVFSWLSSERVAALLAQDKLLDDSQDVEPLFTTLWDASGNGIPEQVARQFFNLLKARYKGYDQWLII